MRRLVFVLAASILAQDQPPLILKSTTRLVQVSVIATRHGKPVTLTRDDFTITDNRKPQSIALFSVESNAGSTASISAVASPPAGTFSNRVEQRTGPHGGVTIILLDSLFTSQTKIAYARAEILGYLKTISPDDRIGIYFLGNGLQIVHDYTSDPREAAAHLKAFKYHGVFQNSLSASIRGTLITLTFIAQNLARLPGRKNLIWISSGFPLSLGLTNPLGPHISYDTEMNRCLRAMNNAGVAIYPIDAQGMTTPQRSEASISGAGIINLEWNPVILPMTAPPRDTMMHLAEDTGGRAYFNANDFAKAIRASIDDANFAYTLGYYPSESKADGKFRQIKVAVNQPDIELRYRKGYIDAPDQPLEEGERKAELHNILTSPLDATELGLSVTMKSLPGKPETIELLIRVDPRGITLDPQNGVWNGCLDVAIVQKDADGKQYNGRDDTLTLRLKEDRYKDVTKNGLAYRQQVPRAIQATELRVAVRNASSGALGSVTIPLPVKQGASSNE